MRALLERLEPRRFLSHLDGVWSGSTGQGLPIGVEIQNDAATHAWGEVSYCGFQESFDLRPPSPVRLNNGHVAVRGSEELFGYRINYVIEGDFQSNNRATGSARASGAPNFCGGDFRTTWELFRDIPADQVEPNDSFDTATNLGTRDQNQQNLTIHEPNNDDYYRWTAAAPGQLTVDLLFAHGSGNLDLELYDANHNLLQSSTSVTDNERITRDVRAAESFFIRVYGYRGATNRQYSLAIDRVPVRDRFEPNSRFETATDLRTGDQTHSDLTIHRPENADYYHWAASADGQLTVDIFFAHDAGNLDLELYDTNPVKPKLLQSATSTTDNERIERDVRAGESFFIRVYSYLLQFTNEYTLVIDGPDQTGEIRGTKWNDLNQNGQQDPDEPGLAGWTIYLDLNNNGLLDEPAEPSTRTGEDGRYSFTDLRPGTYVVAEVAQEGWRQTFPLSSDSGQFRLLGGTGSEGPHRFSLVELQADPVREQLIGPGGYDSGLDVDPASGMLYGASSELRVIDPTDGSTSTMGTIRSATENRILMRSLAFAPDGSLYGVSNTSGILYVINTSTAFATEIGAIPEFVSGIDFSPNGTLYGAYSQLVVLDPATGAIVRKIGDLGGAGVVGLDYAPDGFLYAVNYRPPTLYRIDPSSASTTLIGTYDTELWSVASYAAADNGEGVPAGGRHSVVVSAGTVATGINFGNLWLVPGVSIDETGGSTDVTEGGTGDDYSVVLNSPPTADVTITLMPDNQVRVDKETLVFTPTNWNDRQTVRVTARDDDVMEGPHAGIITHGVISDDAKYAGMTVASVTVNIEDRAGVSITPCTTYTYAPEGAAGCAYTVVLTRQPTADVTITITPDGQVDGDKDRLVFTSANWNIPQTVTVTALDNGLVTIITHSVASSDQDYDSIAVMRVTVVIPCPGDANRDGRFDSSDLVQVFQAGKYETGQPATWEEGDWTGDGLFDSGDLVAAFQAGCYEAAQARAESLFGRNVWAMTNETRPSPSPTDLLGLRGRTPTGSRRGLLPPPFAPALDTVAALESVGDEPASRAHKYESGQLARREARDRNRAGSFDSGGVIAALEARRYQLGRAGVADSIFAHNMLERANGTFRRRIATELLDTVFASESDFATRVAFVP